MSRTSLERPGPSLARAVLHFVLVLDCSGSMNVDGRIQALNNAIREMLPHLRQAADENPQADVQISALSFSTGATWAVEPAPIHEFTWSDITAHGYTDLGHALAMLAQRLNELSTSGRLLAPAVVLLTDGEPTDDFNAGLAALNATPLGAHSVRAGIAVGRDADYEVLRQFQATNADPAWREPFEVHNPEQLAAALQWVSVALSQSASEGTSQTEARDVYQDSVDKGLGDLTW